MLFSHPLKLLKSTFSSSGQSSEAIIFLRASRKSRWSNKNVALEQQKCGGAGWRCRQLGDAVDVDSPRSAPKLAARPSSRWATAARSVDFSVRIRFWLQRWSFEGAPWCRRTRGWRFVAQWSRLCARLLSDPQEVRRPAAMRAGAAQTHHSTRAPDASMIDPCAAACRCHLSIISPKLRAPALQTDVSRRERGACRRRENFSSNEALTGRAEAPCAPIRLVCLRAQVLGKNRLSDCGRGHGWHRRHRLPGYRRSHVRVPAVAGVGAQTDPAVSCASRCGVIMFVVPGGMRRGFSRRSVRPVVCATSAL
jgi:hypothetical protein